MTVIRDLTSRRHRYSVQRGCVACSRGGPIHLVALVQLSGKRNNLMAEIADCPNLAQECWTAKEGNARRMGQREGHHLMDAGPM